MTSLRRHLRSFSWLALFAMLSLAIAPSVSHVLSPRSSSLWGDLCSAVKPSGEQPDAGGAAKRLEHCALCAVAASPLLMSSPPVIAVPQPHGANYIAARFCDAALPGLAWRPPQARAPPLFS